MKTIGSLFAGIGGFDLGFERAGFKTNWVCEIDPQAQAVLRLRFPDAQLHDDVRNVGAHNLGPVDVVTFGSPCQDLSVAVSVSKDREGLAGGKSSLFHEAIRVIQELRSKHGSPEFAIWENVPGAFSSNGGRDFAVVIQSLVDIGARDIAWRVLDSQFFGVAQRRRRVFLVADFGGERAEQILALTQGVRGYREESEEPREQAESTVGEDPSSDHSWRLASGEKAYAITCHQAKGGDPTTDNYAYSSLPAIRRLTPVECCRLQGFPDNWNSEGVDVKGKRFSMADAPRYRQLGNAVTVNVAHWIAKNVAVVYDAAKEPADGKP